jgi:hypothetical protein
MCLHTGMTRRRALQLLAMTMGAAVASHQSTARADGPYPGALIDAHTHFKEGIAPAADELMGLYDTVGIDAALLFGEPWMLAADARNRFPHRVVPFLAEGYATALHPDSSYMQPEDLELLLRGRYVQGLGEMILRHDPFSLGALHGYAAQPANNVPADHPSLITAYRLAGETGVAVNVHQEAAYAGELEWALDLAPETRFVWAHAGHGPASVLWEMLKRHPNLMADISARTPWLGPGTVLLRTDGRMAPEWQNLLTDYADRVVLGLDLFLRPHFSLSYMSQTVSYYRGVLGQLDEGVALLIGHDNAAGLTGLPLAR